MRRLSLAAQRGAAYHRRHQVGAPARRLYNDPPRPPPYSFGHHPPPSQFGPAAGPGGPLPPGQVPWHGPGQAFPQAFPQSPQIVRPVDFPPSRTGFPASWIVASLVMASAMYSNAEKAEERDLANLVRQAGNEVWGAERAEQAWVDLRESVLNVSLAPGADALNATPALMRLDAIGAAVVPALASDNPRIAMYSADVLAEMMRFQRVKEAVLANDALLGSVVTALDKWSCATCGGCGSPSPVLSSLFSVLMHAVETGALSAERLAVVTRVVQAVSAQVEASVQRSGVGVVVEGGEAEEFTRWTWTFNSQGMRGVRKARDSSEPGNGDDGDLCTDPATFAELSLVPISEALAKANPADMVPVFARLMRAFVHVPIQEIALLDAWESAEVLYFSPSLRLGVALATLDAQRGADDLDEHVREREGEGEGEGEEEEERAELLAADWRYFEYARPVLATLADSRDWKAFQVVDSLDRNDLIALPYAALLGFVWGSARTAFALRGAQPPLPQLGHPRRWRMTTAVRHGRLAAIGAVSILAAHMAISAASRRTWLESTTSQVAAHAAATVVFSAVVLAALRRAPFCFAPVVYAALSMRDPDDDDIVRLSFDE